MIRQLQGDTDGAIESYHEVIPLTLFLILSLFALCPLSLRRTD